MDEQQRRRINEAAEQFADALAESYTAVSGRGISVQELYAQLTQQFLHAVINNLRTQGADTRETARELVAQQQRGQEASQQLTQEAVGAYMEFLNSMFSFYQGASQRGAEERRLAT